MQTKLATRARRLSAVQRAYDFLVNEGCSPRLLPDGHPHISQLGFEHDGSLFAVGVDERDPDFMEVTLTLRRRAPLDEITALCVANAVQGMHKLVKVGVGRDPRVMHFQVPLLLRGRPPTRALLQRSMDLLRQAAGEVRAVLAQAPAAQA